MIFISNILNHSSPCLCHANNAHLLICLLAMQHEKQKIAPLSPKELNIHHFGTEWKMNMADFHHLFHINRIEDVRAKNKVSITTAPQNGV